MNNNYIFVTGGLGYIGSHLCIELLEKGHKVVTLDNLSNSKITTLEKIRKISGKKVEFFQGDIRDEVLLENIFNDFQISGVIHLAGLKAVNESIDKPTEYFDVNVSGSINLLKVMQKHKCKVLIFSSSATVYKSSESLLDEESELGPVNPYGQTKLIIEQAMSSICKSSRKSFISLRYFNPVGAHSSGLIGEDPKGIPNNLMPYISQVARGMRKNLKVFGNDYETPDGTGIRDYIHVSDLVKGHLRALDFAYENSGYFVFNLGTGKGYSVLEVAKTYEKCSGQKVPIIISQRREGDIALSIANPSKANVVLKWTAKKGLEDMCRDSWKWEKRISDSQS